MGKGSGSSAPMARRIVRAADKAALATLDAESGAPYASLTSAATAIDGAPGILISTLARHTANIAADPRASLMFESRDADAATDILATARVSVSGRLEKSEDEAFRRRFLARHPDAADYSQFADFAFYLMQVETVHLVAGFGKVRTMEAADFLLDEASVGEIGTIEESAVAHMNADHGEAVALVATRLLGGAEGDWRFAGCDPEGADLVSAAGSLRLDFGKPVRDGEALRRELARLAAAAREAGRG